MIKKEKKQMVQPDWKKLSNFIVLSWSMLSLKSSGLFITRPAWGWLSCYHKRLHDVIFEVFLDFFKVNFQLAHLSILMNVIGASKRVRERERETDRETEREKEEMGDKSYIYIYIYICVCVCVCVCVCACRFWNISD